MGNNQSNNIIELNDGDEDLNIPDVLDSKNIKIKSRTAQYLLEHIFNFTYRGNISSSEFISFNTFINLAKQKYRSDRSEEISKILNYELQIAVLKNKIEELQRVIKAMRESTDKQIKITKEIIEINQKMLNGGEVEKSECNVCFESYILSEIKTLKCHHTHKLCNDCYYKIIASENKKCPTCRAKIN